MDYAGVKSMISQVWEPAVTRWLIDAKIDVSLYPALLSEVPDEVIEITEVFPMNEFETIGGRFQPFLSEHHVCPFLETLGGNVVCVGYHGENLGSIFYFDFDFGLFRLAESLGEFLSVLKRA